MDEIKAALERGSTNVLEEACESTTSSGRGENTIELGTTKPDGAGEEKELRECGGQQ